MFLKPGRRLRVKHSRSGDSAEASILSAAEKEIILQLSPGLNLYPGDEIELELRRWGDALCILQASVLEVSENKVYVLQEQTGLRRPQRRRSDRIPANIWTEYLLLPKKDFDNYREGLIQNISRHGVLLTVQEPLNLHSRLFLVFEAPSGRGAAYTTGLKGRVVREHRAPGKGDSSYGVYSYGVEFDRPLTLSTG